VRKPLRGFRTKGNANEEEIASGRRRSQYDLALLEVVCQAANGETVVIEDADHGMDITDDPVASVCGLERIVEALVRFLQQMRSIVSDLVVVPPARTCLRFP
jgi:hypothetical protein